MTVKLLIDTDVIIDYLRGAQKAADFIEKSFASAVCCISTISVAELYAGVREGNERKVLTNFLGLFNIIPVDELIAQQGGLYRRDYGKKHGTGLADALVAATAQSISAKLATLNKKHFPMAEKILIPYSKNEKVS